MQSCRLGTWMGYHLSTEVYTKGVPFLLKIEYKRVRLDFEEESRQVWLKMEFSFLMARSGRPVLSNGKGPY